MGKVHRVAAPRGCPFRCSSETRFRTCTDRIGQLVEFSYPTHRVATGAAYPLQRSSVPTASTRGGVPVSSVRRAGIGRPGPNSERAGFGSCQMHNGKPLGAGPMLSTCGPRRPCVWNRRNRRCGRTGSGSIAQIGQQRRQVSCQVQHPCNAWRHDGPVVDEQIGKAAQLPEPITGRGELAPHTADLRA